MDITECVKRVICLEESLDPDWDQVKRLCDAAIININEEGYSAEVDNRVYQFLEDYDVRQKDRDYGKRQRDSVKELLDSFSS